eukprot:765595-Prymnesium_polylepis.1
MGPRAAPLRRPRDAQPSSSPDPDALTPRAAPESASRRPSGSRYAVTSSHAARACLSLSPPRGYPSRA